MVELLVPRCSRRRGLIQPPLKPVAHLAIEEPAVLAILNAKLSTESTIVDELRSGEDIVRRSTRIERLNPQADKIEVRVCS